MTDPFYNLSVWVFTICIPASFILSHYNFNARGFDLLTGLVTDGPAGLMMGGRENKVHF